MLRTERASTMVRRSAAVVVALLVAACAAAPADSTGDFAVGDPSGEANAFAPGTGLLVGTSSFQRTAGEPVELLSVTPLGLSAAVHYEAFVSPVAGTGELGLFPETEVPEAARQGLRLLTGTRLGQSDGWTQVILRVAMPSEEVNIHGYRVRYRLADGSERAFYLPYSDHICIAPHDTCELLQPHP
jgi:hypothetical protein